MVYLTKTYKKSREIISFFFLSLRAIIINEKVILSFSLLISQVKQYILFSPFKDFSHV